MRQTPVLARQRVRTAASAKGETRRASLSSEAFVVTVLALARTRVACWLSARTGRALGAPYSTRAHKSPLGHARGYGEHVAPAFGIASSATTRWASDAEHPVHRSPSFSASSATSRTPSSPSAACSGRPRGGCWLLCPSDGRRRLGVRFAVLRPGRLSYRARPSDAIEAGWSGHPLSLPPRSISNRRTR